MFSEVNTMLRAGQALLIVMTIVAIAGGPVVGTVSCQLLSTQHATRCCLPSSQPCEDQAEIVPTPVVALELLLFFNDSEDGARNLSPSADPFNELPRILLSQPDRSWLRDEMTLVDASCDGDFYPHLRI